MRGAVWVGAVAVLLAAGPAVGQSKKPDVLAKLDGHLGGVSAVAFSAKGDRVATGAGNGEVRVWDAKAPNEALVALDDQKSSSARVGLVAFSADGKYLSASSRNTVGVWDLSDPKRPVQRYEDPYTADPIKLGTVTGDGKLCYFLGTESGFPKLQSYSLKTRTVGSVDLPAKTRPVAAAPLVNPRSGLVAFFCAVGDKGEFGSVVLVGLGETRALTKDVPFPVTNKPASVGFSPDAKWLVVGNGSKVVYWAVPGSQVIEGEPKTLAGEWAVAAAGPGNRVAVASVPQDGRTVTVSVIDIGGTAPKVTAEYASGMKRVSALAFSPDGSVLAVGDDAEGVVQLWALK